MAWFRSETAAPLAHLCALAAGTSRLVLRGRVVTLDAAASVLPDALLAVEKNKIVHIGVVGQQLPPGFASVPVIETGGTIYPGLVELHNHPSYNAIPLWDVPQRFANRSKWRDDPRYKRKVKAPASLLTHDPTSQNALAVIRFVECRALLGGVTATQGLSIEYMKPATKDAYRGLVRNLEFPDDTTWPTAFDQINDFKSVKEANDVYGPMINDRLQPFIMHVSEGTDDDARKVFEFLKREDGTRLIGSNFVAVHGTALDEAQIQALATGAGLVWSPLSNYLLYGETANVTALRAAGVPIALGSDWGPSGTKNLLGELKIARAVSDHLNGLFSDLELVRMVTSTPAKMVGWDPYLGSVEVGKVADLLVLDGTSGDPYANLIAAAEDKVCVVIIDGRPRVGRATVLDPTRDGVELIRVAGQDMVLDITESPTHPLAKMSLATAIATLSYALEHLPDLAGKFAAQHELLGGVERLFLHLDLDEEFAMGLVTAAVPIQAGDVDPMKLDPVTSVDDKTFGDRLRANPNLPAWLRAAI
jgi:5-methylthioadenosine/S-adenosylhomocysteine deaminase